MNTAAILSLFPPTSEVPFSAQRKSIREGVRLMQLIRRAVPSKFRPPPLPAVFGPGTKLPKGPAVPKPARKSRKR